MKTAFVKGKLADRLIGRFERQKTAVPYFKVHFVKSRFDNLHFVSHPNDHKSFKSEQNVFFLSMLCDFKQKKSDEFQDMEKGEFMDCYRLIDRVNKMCTMKKCRDGFLVKIPSNY